MSSHSKYRRGSQGPTRQLTPPTLPPERICRSLPIPDSQQWLGAVNGALLPLTDPDNWEQLETTDLTPEAVASQFWLMLDVFWAGLGCLENAMDVRQNPDNPCLLEKTVDGVNWVQFANLRLCVPLIRYDAVNRRIQQSDDGFGWFDVDEGPWVDSAPQWTYPEPAGRLEDTADERRCLAAANAAFVLRETYKGIGDNLAQEVASQLQILDHLNELLEALLAGVGGKMAFWGIAEGIFAIQAVFAAVPFTEEGFAELVCILLDNATDNGEGNPITFNYNGVHTALTGSTFDELALVGGHILPPIGESGLATAGGVNYQTSYDCDYCDDAPPCDPNGVTGQDAYAWNDPAKTAPDGTSNGPCNGEYLYAGPWNASQPITERCVTEVTIQYYRETNASARPTALNVYLDNELAGTWNLSSGSTGCFNLVIPVSPPRRISNVRLQSDEVAPRRLIWSDTWINYVEDAP